MPSTKEKFFESASGPDRYGAGGEPPGEPPAPPLGVLGSARALSQARVDDAVERARLRGMVERPGGERIPDEVIDQLLAGAQDRGGDRRARRAVGAVDQAAGGAGDGGRADRPSGLRAARRAAGRGGEHAQRDEPEDADHRARAGPDRRAAGSRRQLPAEDRSQAPAPLSRGSTTRSWRSTRAGSRRATSRRTWRRSTA